MSGRFVRPSAKLPKKPNSRSIKDKLTTLCDELEPLATKLYFKTQKGTEDMEEMAKEIEVMKDKLFACEQAEAAQGMCIPFFVKIEKIIEHVKTMRVRMT